MQACSHSVQPIVYSYCNSSILIFPPTQLVTLPNMRQKRKEKITDSIHERILRAWVVRVKVAAAPVGAPRDWNPALVLLTTAGHLLTYSLPDLRLCFHQQNFLPASDHK